MKCPSYNVFFETIANKTRIQILETLEKSAMSVSEICKKLNQEQSKISHNLKIPMADSIIFVTAKLFDATIWTRDSDFENLQHVNFFSK